MFQLRIYTLRSPEALQRYATVHWDWHLATFPKFGIVIHGVWTEQGDGANRLGALVRYLPGVAPEDLTGQIMTSPEFAAGMAASTSMTSSRSKRRCSTRPRSRRFAGTNLEWLSSAYR